MDGTGRPLNFYALGYEQKFRDQIDLVVTQLPWLVGGYAPLIKAEQQQKVEKVWRTRLSALKERILSLEGDGTAIAQALQEVDTLKQFLGEETITASIRRQCEPAMHE